MGRRKVVLEHISNGSSPASTFKKRQASIIKIAELSKLCGIDVCVVVSAGSDDKAPVVWTPQEQAAHYLSSRKSAGGCVEQEAVRAGGKNATPVAKDRARDRQYLEGYL
ncbi:agamous-like MADS-box protein AGL80 [Carex rostrata]